MSQICSMMFRVARGASPRPLRPVGGRLSAPLDCNECNLDPTQLFGSKSSPDRPFKNQGRNFCRIEKKQKSKFQGEGADAAAGRVGNAEDSRGPQRPREGTTGNSKHHRTNLEHIWENQNFVFFFDPKCGSFFGFEWVIWA